MTTTAPPYSISSSASARPRAAPDRAMREAEALIRSAIAAQPGAPYYMAQTIVVQNAALREAERRIVQLESQDEEQQGGLFGGLFGGGRGRGSVPPTGRRREDPALCRPARAAVSLPARHRPRSALPAACSSAT